MENLEKLVNNLREYDNDLAMFSIEDKNLIEQINSHAEIVFSYNEK